MLNYLNIMGSFFLPMIRLFLTRIVKNKRIIGKKEETMWIVKNKRIIGKKKETMCISNQCIDAITALSRDP